MSVEESVSIELRELILELQSYQSLQKFALAGGTSLALRYNHRISNDMDLFVNEIVGIEGLKEIEKEIKEKYNDSIVNIELVNQEGGDQYSFLRMFLRKRKEVIKVEILQNMQFLYPVEKLNNIRLCSLKDVGIFKLQSAAERKAEKDIYDLDHITEDIPLLDLLNDLALKLEKFKDAQYHNLFDLDSKAETTPVGKYIPVLLDFDDKQYISLPLRTNHSDARIKLLAHSLPWREARRRWIGKVKLVCRGLGIDVPGIKPLN